RPRFHFRRIPTAGRPSCRLGGNKRSAFFFCLPLRAKSTMAEILVSDFCERMFRRKPAPRLDRGWTPVRRQEHAPIKELSAPGAGNGGGALALRPHAPGCPTVPMGSAHCFFHCFFHCFHCSRAFRISHAISISSIVFRLDSAL